MGVLAARQAIGQPRHPRVAEPSAVSVLAQPGALGALTVDEGATVLDALRLMAERDATAVAVMSPRGLVGVFSERDHARSGFFEGRTAKDAPIADVMTRNAPCVAPADSVRRCVEVMTERRVPHAAVLDEGRLVGLLSLTDALAAEVAYLERICHETELDQKLLNLRGTYSC
jgi:signal-transduction protein with cAMP-binding, CBS, and nucleotidyltransferase domain